MAASNSGTQKCAWYSTYGWYYYSVCVNKKDRYISDFAPASSNEFLDIQATIECGFTLKRVRDMTRTLEKPFKNTMILSCFNRKDASDNNVVSEANNKFH